MPHYAPSPDATYYEIWDIVQLSQRDVSFQVPINYLPYVSVALTPACFGHGYYVNNATAKCVSNLLASGFRRFFIDLYWNQVSKQWQLCPVEILPDEKKMKGEERDDDETTSDAHQIHTRTDQGVKQGSYMNLGERDSIPVLPRAKSSRLPLQHIGGYTCSKSHSLESLLKVISEYLDATEDTLSAHMVYFILNLNVAQPAYAPKYIQPRAHHDQSPGEKNHTASHDDASSSVQDSPNAKPKNGTEPDMKKGFPDDASSLSSIFSRSIGSRLYTPPTLQAERSNLDKSWFSAPPDSRPISEYFTVVGNPGRSPYSSTPNGWPCESYIEMTLGKRAIIAFGEANGKMSAYNFTADADWIFPRGTLAENANITLAREAIDDDDRDKTYKTHIEQGCLYDSKSTKINRTLDKWWYSPLLSPKGDPVTGTGTGDDNENDHHSSTFNYSDKLARGIVDCGVSLLVNATLENSTADTHPVNYLDLLGTSIWSWADREPSSAGSASTLEDGRCAALDTSRDGQWRARDCGFHFHGACRVGNEPYSWVITQKRVSYEDVDKHCPNGTHFSVPRTPLENTYLYTKILSEPHQLMDAHDDTTKHSVWLDFNSIDVAQCWVVGHGKGGNTKCPYHIDSSGISRKNVLVPTVAAIIALAVTALMLLVKCNVNRRNSRRKRVIEGWQYEGVPS
ncbi:NADPH-adrenodoxin reductase [Ascosphaera pollenicola]|nr:NADPH-adrenodoxin reductase [Ascosphaera pollenicola]